MPVLELFSMTVDAGDGHGVAQVVEPSFQLADLRSAEVSCFCNRDSLTCPVRRIDCAPQAARLGAGAARGAAGSGALSLDF